MCSRDFSLNAEKAFDMVAWDYMATSMKAIGIPPMMLAYIMVLYSNPSAKVRVNGTLSEAFAIINGTRQRCPLSPLIYVLRLEPLLRRLRSNPDIKGIQIKDWEYRTTAFADDVMLFLSNTLTSLPVLVRDLELFRTLSNLKINYNKSYALNISLPQLVVDRCKASLPFMGQDKSITYLGIQIPTDLQDLYASNYLNRV